MDIVAVLTKGGVPYGDACIIADLATHAANEAQHAMTRVADTAPERLQVQVLMVTTLIMEGVIRDSKQCITDTFGSRRARQEDS